MSVAARSTVPITGLSPARVRARNTLLANYLPWDAVRLCLNSMRFCASAKPSQKGALVERHAAAKPHASECLNFRASVGTGIAAGRGDDGHREHGVQPERDPGAGGVPGAAPGHRPRRAAVPPEGARACPAHETRLLMREQYCSYVPAHRRAQTTRARFVSMPPSLSRIKQTGCSASHVADGAS